jgi:glycosyltransferase involved in cell wall biosynthesis
MKLKPLVSVIMPVYNGGEFLEVTIRSILLQEFREFEFIIVNDGSKDRTEEIVLSFSDQRIRYIKNESNRGLIYSLNLAIEKARGEYIARIDADDVAGKGRLRKQLDFLESHCEIAICGTFYKIIDRNGETGESVELPVKDLDIRTYLLFGNCFCHSSIMIRAEVMRQYLYSKDYNLCEDYDLWFRVMIDHKVANIPSFHTLYRVHGENISTRKREEMLRCVKAIHGRALHFLNIPFSEEELILHNALLGFDHARCMQYEKAVIYTWLIKFSSHLSRNRHINRKLALKVFIRRWATVCINAREYGLFINNPLFTRYGMFYLQCVTEKIIDRSFNRNRGLDL